MRSARALPAPASASSSWRGSRSARPAQPTWCASPLSGRKRAKSERGAARFAKDHAAWNLDVAAFDLLGQTLHEIRHLLQMRVHGKRAAECLERELVLVEFLHDDAKSGQGAEMARLARQHLADVGQRPGIVL